MKEKRRWLIITLNLSGFILLILFVYYHDIFSEQTNEADLPPETIITGKPMESPTISPDKIVKEEIGTILENKSDQNEVDSAEDTEKPRLNVVADSTIDEISKRGNSILDNPVHPGRAHIQSQMRQETFQETFFQLTDLYNFAMIMGSMGGQALGIGSYGSDIRMVVKMTRMRKLLEDAKANPQEVASFLQDQLVLMTEQLDSVYQEYVKQCKAGMNSYSELPDYRKYQVRSTAAVYILSQINAFESLPTLAKISTLGKSRDEPDLPTIGGPVHRKFIFYAMHKLVHQFPTSSLSPEARQAQDKYLNKANAMNIPESRNVKGTSWNTPYHEDDYRLQASWTNIEITQSDLVELELFPELNQLTKEDIDSLLVDMRSFVKLAFPEREIK